MTLAFSTKVFLLSFACEEVQNELLTRYGPISYRKSMLVSRHCRAKFFLAYHDIPRRGNLCLSLPHGIASRVTDELFLCKVMFSL